ncbi:L-threonylcarbamoyladenylate synthase [Candidatus Mycoplasma mahonii]|uniref:L-threonylcarbamoyladenylate synthase n=1 Tax=Candidatus Mycoplasma mahonii TaxID=3004105 RepID=UPI0026EAB48E|nr:Sua5/YciO/YrdC/YwlC family protein [Candidatus Mycoplasma mahonii]WKX02495.1 Sua5/YciO/YrdC/YwlC family protein [Candidatus Mycoplasma mahonii]
MENIYKELFLTTTDTVVGIGAPVSPKNKKAIMKIKFRSNDKKLIIMVGSIVHAKKLKGWTEIATHFAEKVWPGQTTLVINDTLAVRVPDKPALQGLLRLKGPCYMTSANKSGKKHLSLADAKETFPKILEYHDYGEGSERPSKIIDIRNNEVLR